MLGLLQGNIAQFLAQLIGVGVVVAYVLVVSFVLMEVVDLLIGLRVKSVEEYFGLDFSQYEEEAYAWG